MHYSPSPQQHQLQLQHGHPQFTPHAPSLHASAVVAAPPPPPSLVDAAIAEAKDPVGRAKALAVAVRRALEHLLDVAARNLKYNAHVDVAVGAGGPLQPSQPPPPTLESALEDFVLVCNRLELQLQVR
jgi:hypothetical protein